MDIWDGFCAQSKSTCSTLTAVNNIIEALVSQLLQTPQKKERRNKQEVCFILLSHQKKNCPFASDFVTNSHLCERGDTIIRRGLLKRKESRATALFPQHIIHSISSVPQSNRKLLIPPSFNYHINPRMNQTDTIHYYQINIIKSLGSSRPLRRHGRTFKSLCGCWWAARG